MHSFTRSTLKNFLGSGHSPFSDPPPLRMGHYSSNPTALAPMAPRPPRLRRRLDVFGR